MGRICWTRLIYRTNTTRFYSVDTCKTQYNCKLLVVGGGAGGCSVAARLAWILRNNDVIVLEPSQVHYYQPLFPLVSAGIKKYQECHRPQKSVLPKRVRWLADKACEFDPSNNAVYTAGGHLICYQYMVVAVGLVNDYEKIPGLQKALEDPNSGVSTIYAPEYCRKTWDHIRRFRGGHAVFTYPHAVGKCSGAALKIMYLADDYWRRHKLREQSNITYLTGGETIFGVPKYAQSLERVASKRCIAVNYCVELLEVNKQTAVFQDSGGQTISLPYNLLHVTPPMSPPACLRNCKKLVNNQGYLDVDLHTLQHRNYSNVFGIGDCLCTPNSKTAAAVGEQSGVVAQNLLSVISGETPSAKYGGYGACPLLTSYRTGILAEYLYDKELRETFPFDQSKESYFLYYIKTSILPYIYWNRLLKGKWDGPARIRKIINPLGK